MNSPYLKCYCFLNKLNFPTDDLYTPNEPIWAVYRIIAPVRDAVASYVYKNKDYKQLEECWKNL